MKAEDSCSRLARQHDGARLRHVARPARAIDGERRVASIADVLRKLRQRAESAARTRAPRRPVTESLNTLGDCFAVQIHTGHDDDAAVAPVIGRRKDSTVPEGEY